MATSTRTHRAVAIGVSGALGAALPFAAYAATLPFGDAGEAFRPYVAPVAAGAVAGVGILAAADSIARRSSARAEGRAPDVSREEERPKASERACRPQKGVPVISRAQNALEEGEAWAEIDAAFGDDSPISCDATRSHDIYEVALEELRRAEAARAGAAQAEADRPDAPPAGTGAAPAPARGRRVFVPTAVPSTTAEFIALANGGAPAGSKAAAPAVQPAPVRAVATQAAPASQKGDPAAAATGSLAEAVRAARAAQATSDASPVIESRISSTAREAPACDEATESMTAEARTSSWNRALDAMGSLSATAPHPEGSMREIAACDDPGEAEENRDRAAAMASLYGARAQEAVAPVMPPIARAGSAAPAAGDVPAAETTGSFSVGAEVPVADYSGHEAMWAAAIAILEEGRSPDLSETSYVSPERMAAVAEGGHATRRHDRVNEILGEEIGRSDSSSVRKSGYEFLRVIQGGTASMPKIQAQA